MSPRVGRPKANTIKKVFTFYFHPVRDADVLAYLERNPRKQSQAIIRAMRAGIQPDNASSAGDDDRLAADDLLSNWDF